MALWRCCKLAVSTRSLCCNLWIIINNYWTKYNYWTRLSKILWFFCGEQISYLRKPKAEANNWSARHWQVTIFCDNRVQELFYHSIKEFVFLMNILGKWSDLPFLCKSDRNKEISTVSFMHQKNIICSQTLLDGIAHEQTIICRQLFAGHVVDSWPMKRKKNLLQMIIIFIAFITHFNIKRYDQMRITLE